MDKAALFGAGADAILLVHFLFVAFVVLGFAAILTGKLAGWAWVRNRWFRNLHVIAIGVVSFDHGRMLARDQARFGGRGTKAEVRAT